jgi:hypothetical protein
MKTKIIFSLLLLLTGAIAVSAQEVFPLSGAKWTERITIGEEESTYYSYVLQGDTIVDDILRSKLYYIPDINRKDSILTALVHIEDKKVVFWGIYCEEYEQDLPLYDFSLAVRDTFQYCEPSGGYYYYVSEIDEANLGGISRKGMTVISGKYIGDRWMEFDIDYWIEGMGSVKGLFNIIKKGPMSVHWDLICFTLNDELIYLNPQFSECPVPNFTSIPEVKTNPLRIFPNPMKLLATVQSDQPLQAIQIYDISGVLLYKQACNGELQTVIERQSLLQGTYFMKITFQTGETRTEKLIIQ